MLNENAQKWVAALRSGEYTQGYHDLRKKDNSFCALGVATDLYIKEIGSHWQEMYGNHYSYETHCSLAPDSVIQWLKLSDHLGKYKTGSIVDCNDNQRLSFTEIADIIESEPARLFRE